MSFNGKENKAHRDGLGGQSYDKLYRSCDKDKVTWIFIETHYFSHLFFSQLSDIYQRLSNLQLCPGLSSLL